MTDEHFEKDVKMVKPAMLEFHPFQPYSQT